MILCPARFIRVVQNVMYPCAKQITKGLGHVGQVTQQNTSLAEQSASAAQELTGQAQCLKELVRTFKVLEDTSLYRKIFNKHSMMLNPAQQNTDTAVKEAVGAPHIPWGKKIESVPY